MRGQFLPKVLFSMGEILYMVQQNTNTLIHGSTVLLLHTKLHSLFFILPHDNLKFSLASIKRKITKLNSLVIAKRKSLLFVGAASFSLSSTVSSHLLCKLCSWALIVLSYRTGVLVLIFWTQGHIVFQFLCTKQMVDDKQVEIILMKGSINQYPPAI